MKCNQSRIWTCVAVSNSCDDNHYTTGTSILCTNIGCPIHSALCHIKAKSFVNYYYAQIIKVFTKLSLVHTHVKINGKETVFFKSFNYRGPTFILNPGLIPGLDHWITNPNLYLGKSFLISHCCMPSTSILGNLVSVSLLWLLWEEVNESLTLFLGVCGEKIYITIELEHLIFSGNEGVVRHI